MNKKKDRPIQGEQDSMTKDRKCWRRGEGDQLRMGAAEEGAALNLASSRRNNKNSFQKLEWAQCLIFAVVTSGDLLPLQTISWVF